MITKSIKKVSYLAIIMALFFFSCNENEKKRPTSQQPTDKIKAPKQTIDYKYANNLEEEYKKTRAAVINKYLEKEDSREFWFDLDQLKEYIAYVEQEAKDKGYNNLGIRIYNGAYPNDKAYPDPGYSTVFLVPTGKKAISKSSFSPLNTTLMNEKNENILSIKAYNYGQAGRPPKELR